MHWKISNTCTHIPYKWEQEGRMQSRAMLTRPFSYVPFCTSGFTLMALGCVLFCSHDSEERGDTETRFFEFQSFGAVLRFVSEGKRQSQGLEGSWVVLEGHE